MANERIIKVSHSIFLIYEQFFPLEYNSSTCKERQNLDLWHHLSVTDMEGKYPKQSEYDSFGKRKKIFK